MKNALLLLCILISAFYLSACTCEYHSYEEKIIKEPTCTTAGELQKYCTECGYEIKLTIDSRHNYKQARVIKKPTCIQSGNAIYKCTVCGETEERSIFEQHNFSGRTCTMCGYEEPLPELYVGMSQSRVKRKWGEPVEIEKSTSSRGTVETWWYKNGGKTIAVNFDVDGNVWLINEY